MLKYFFCLLLIASINQKTKAQTAIDTSLSILKPIAIYYESLGPQSPLYNGSEYLNYANTLHSGHPYYSTTEFTRGTILFEGMEFRDAMLLYDIVKDKVILQHHDNFHQIDLPPKKIEQFTLANRHFFRLLPDSAGVIAEGFYGRLYHGKTDLYVKRKKKIREERTGTEINMVIDELIMFYILKQGLYHQAKNMRVLLKVLSDKREQIRQHLKKNGVKFKRDPEKAMIMAVEYYDRLSN